MLYSAEALRVGRRAKFTFYALLLECLCFCVAFFEQYFYRYAINTPSLLKSEGVFYFY
ncbi:hypothetical protein FTV88_0627 [Heliorestis convoluta]|uniref:Uncharacterized protein n=1 Tax=Heliorestis convoluta TaxID=356322 RepID=A0A5Q2MZY8_9FIRM|nr:hypothetical protein FTV88_0627 [Heliorestis convoluta]